ncbi:MAG: response regulator [Deltaproteobacteria bacterium]|nr:response regulator [Deltaproteobacteria bacterium]
MQREVTILLAEDNPEDEVITVRALKRSQVCDRVEIARDGAEVLDQLFAESATGVAQKVLPDLILLDLNLPKLSGFSVLSRIRQDERTRFIPVVVLSSSAQEDDVKESYRLGANSYVRKPVDFERFVDAVAHIGRYWLDINQVPSG